MAFAKVLRAKLNARFPEFGTDRLINCFGNLLNSSAKGVHLKLVGKFESTKDDNEEKLGEWKSDHGLDMMEVDDDEEEVAEQPQKLSATEALKKRLKEQEARKEQQQAQSGSRGGRMTMGSEVNQFHFIILFFSSSLFLCLEILYKISRCSPQHQLQLLQRSRRSAAATRPCPMLSYLARVVFAVPAASSKSERVFSVAGIL